MGAPQGLVRRSGDRDGWYGRPGWATDGRTATFADRVAAEIAAQVRRIFTLREGT